MCCRCCVRKCPKCRRDPIKKPYSDNEVCCPITFFIILGVITFALAVFANQANSDYVQAFDYSVCQIGQLYEETVYGANNQTYSWSGTSSITTQLSSASSGMSALTSSISSTFGSNSAFASSGAMETQLTQISNQFSSTASRSIANDPATAASLEIPYLATIGSATVSSSIVGELEANRLEVIGNSLNSIISLETKANSVDSGSSGITANFTAASSKLTDLQT